MSEKNTDRLVCILIYWSRGRTVAEGQPRTAYGMRTHGAVVGRRFRSVTKLTTKVRIGRDYLWGSFLIAAAALKTPTRNCYNAQGVNLNFYVYLYVTMSISIDSQIDNKIKIKRCVYKKGRQKGGLQGGDSHEREEQGPAGMYFKILVSMCISM